MFLTVYRAFLLPVLLEMGIPGPVNFRTNFITRKTLEHQCVEKGNNVFFSGRRLLAAGTKYAVSAS